MLWIPVFSSPELKVEVSFSDCLSVRKLFTFSSSSPEPLSQFQPNLAQSIFGWRRFKFVQMKGTNHPWMKDIQNFKNKGSRPFIKGGYYEMAKIHWRNLKILFSRSTGPISTKLGTKRPFGVGTQSFTNIKHLILKKEIMGFLSLLINVMI